MRYRRRSLRNGERAFPSRQGRGHGAGKPGRAEAVEGESGVLIRALSRQHSASKQCCWGIKNLETRRKGGSGGMWLELVLLISYKGTESKKDRKFKVAHCHF